MVGVAWQSGTLPDVLPPQGKMGSSASCSPPMTMLLCHLPRGQYWSKPKKGLKRKVYPRILRTFIGQYWPKPKKGLKRKPTTDVHNSNFGSVLVKTQEGVETICCRV